uniref:Uncharacterized protein n=1 Tax=Vitis vinifera TaxID=29760 RepID=F6HJ04_VITVI
MDARASYAFHKYHMHFTLNENCIMKNNIAQVAKISVMKKASGQWEGALSAISSI